MFVAELTQEVNGLRFISVHISEHHGIGIDYPNIGELKIKVLVVSRSTICYEITCQLENT